MKLVLTNRALRPAALFATCLLLQVSQTLALGAASSSTNILVFEDMKVPRWLAEMVVEAARATNNDPAYLLALADKESSLVPHTENPESSAEGLFQFIESTWLEVMRRHGPKHGFVAAGEAIHTVEGRPVVPDSERREAILRLRKDPYVSALMAGEMINAHRQILAGEVARDPSPAELYMAHFLGVNGARRLLDMLNDQPGKSAPEAFPQAARANRSLFFGKVAAGRQLKSLSLSEVQARISAMIDKRVERYASVRGDLASFEVATAD